MLIRDTFDDTVMGRLVTPGWSASPNADLLTVAAFPTGVDRSALLTAPPEEQPATACRDLPDVAGRYTLQADIRLSGKPALGTLISVESSGALARIDRARLSVLFMDGEDAVARRFRIELDGWYRVTLQVDTGLATYTAGIEDLSGAGNATIQEGLALAPSDNDANRLCFHVSTNSAASMNIDDVMVDTP